MTVPDRPAATGDSYEIPPADCACLLLTDPTAATGVTEPTAILPHVPYLIVPYHELLPAAGLLLLISLIPLLTERRRPAPFPITPAPA